MPCAVKLRDDSSAAALRALARRSKDVNQSYRLLSLAALRYGWAGERRPDSAAWTGRRCATGSSVQRGRP
jgi:hypothetical protein